MTATVLGRNRKLGTPNCHRNVSVVFADTVNGADVTLSVLLVAYPFAPVSPDSVGGAEQVVSTLDGALVARGHHCSVIACAGSQVAGDLVALPRPGGVFDDAAKQEAWRRCRAAIEDVLRHRPIDLIHLHGVDCFSYLPAPGVPTVITLHLPVGAFPREALSLDRPLTWLHGVSATQHAALDGAPDLLPPIANGVDVERLFARHAKRRFALVLGRICPEKGVHLAIEAARRAGIALFIAGEVFPYVEHQQYFADEIVPRLDRRRRFIGPIGFLRKRRLLTAAQCLLVPSLIAETSSLVAREALACGTPVVAFARGALPEAIDHGQTGFLVEEVEAMAQAIDACVGLSSAHCREVARARFSQQRMTDEYLALYRRLARHSEMAS